MTPDIDKGCLTIEWDVCGDCKEGTAVIREREYRLDAGVKNRIPLEDFDLWSPEHPKLYDIEFRYRDDRVRSYFAMRKFGVSRDKDGILRLTLNNRPYFHTGLLDQGYWPDGLLTAPSDEALVHDIQAMKSLGFNMLRKHIKIEPLRWYYHCDRLGMLVWQDMPSGGGRYRPAVTMALPFLGIHLKDGEKNYAKFARQDREGRKQYDEELDCMIAHLYNSPSVAVWVPFNEGWGQFDALGAVGFIRQRDTTRTIDHASGWHDQGGGDVKSIHVYYKPVRFPTDAARAVVLSEFGGYSLAEPGHVCDSEKVFGYRKYADRESFNNALRELYEKQVIPLVAKGLSAAVYTQLSDVEQEVNGLLTFDREVCKADLEMMTGVNRRIAGETAYLPEHRGKNGEEHA